MSNESMNRHAVFRPNVCDRIISIRTPENIEFSYRIAGAGTRGAAYLLDCVILFCVNLVLIQSMAAVPSMVKSMSAWLAAVMGMAIFVMFHGYFTWFEWKANGRTPGKKALGIQVIKEGGYALSFTDSLLRNLLRFADFLPFLNGVGFASICLTAHGQRLGDLVAATLVVHQDEILIDSMSPRIPSTFKSAPALPSHQLLALPPEVHDLAVEFFRYVDTLVPPHRQELAAAIVQLIAGTTGLSPAAKQSSEGFLAAVINQAGRVVPAAAPPVAETLQHSSPSSN